MLDFLSQDVWGQTRTDSWALPKCLRRDEGTELGLKISHKAENASVILLEDLGKLLSIYTSVARSAKTAASPERDVKLSRLGSILGRSLAHLHSSKTMDVVKQQPHVAETLSLSLTDAVVWTGTMVMLPQYLEKFPDGARLYQRLVEDVKAPKYDYPECLVHGDFHTGNVMMSQDDTSGLEQRPVVIDWEFCNLHGRGINGDVPQFLSSLHCHLIGARTKDPACAHALRQFCRGFCSAYRDAASLRCKRDAGQVNCQLLRSALLLHGRDMVNYAIEFLGDDGEVDQMVNVGVWYMRRACDDMNGFVSDENWSLLRDEDEMFIQSLFLSVEST